MTNSSSAESTGIWRLIQPEQVLDMAINDVEFLTELIDLFVALAPEQMQDIRRAIDSNDAGLLAKSPTPTREPSETTLRPVLIHCCSHWKMTANRQTSKRARASFKHWNKRSMPC